MRKLDLATIGLLREIIHFGRAFALALVFAPLSGSRRQRYALHKA
jgi:hypothetical protein